MLSFARFCTALCALSLFCGAVGAQVYPAKAIRIIIGFPPGSTPDIVTRIVADKMGEDLVSRYSSRIGRARAARLPRRPLLGHPPTATRSTSMAAAPPGLCTRS